MMTAYTHGVLVLSLGGQVAHDLVGSPNAFVNGAVLSLFAIVSGVVGIVARSLPARVAMILGALASATGMGLLAVAVALHDLPIFLLATAIAGAGYSLLFLSALEVINAAAPAHTAAACSRPSICWPICRWAALPSSWAPWRPQAVSASPSISAPAPSPSSAPPPSPRRSNLAAPA